MDRKTTCLITQNLMVYKIKQTAIKTVELLNTVPTQCQNSYIKKVKWLTNWLLFLPIYTQTQIQTNKFLKISTRLTLYN